MSLSPRFWYNYNNVDDDDAHDEHAHAHDDDVPCHGKRNKSEQHHDDPAGDDDDVHGEHAHDDDDDDPCQGKRSISEQHHEDPAELSATRTSTAECDRLARRGLGGVTVSPAALWGCYSFTGRAFGRGDSFGPHEHDVRHDDQVHEQHHDADDGDAKDARVL